MAEPTIHSGIGLNYSDQADGLQKLTLGGFAVGLLCICISGISSAGQQLFMFSGIGLSLISLTLYFLQTYFKSQPGIKNNGVWLRKSTSRGNIAWLTGVFLTGFYIVLYWWPYLLTGLMRGLDPLSTLLRGKAADQWFLYGTFYTLAIFIMGVRALLKYRHSQYQIIRTLSVIFFQLVFAYLIPHFLVLLNQPEFHS